MSAGSSRGKAWDAVRQQVLDRDGWQCSYCGRLLEGLDATVDHLIAVNNGGTDDPANCVSSCRSCNSVKGARVMQRLSGFNPNWLDRIA